MLKIRVIPILTFNGFALVKTKNFGNPRMVGNPVQSARVFNSRNVDELIFLDIFASAQKRKLNSKIVKPVINECFMPVAIGGGIDSIEDIHNLLNLGADKVVIKTKAQKDPSFIKEAVKIFGSQAIVVAVDVKTIKGHYVLHHFDKDLDLQPAIPFVKRVEDFGAGELCVTDVESEGLMKGYNVQMIQAIRKKTELPIIVNGGAGVPKDFSDVLNASSVTGIAASSIFYYTKFTPFDIKSELKKHGHPVRIFDSHLANTLNQ